MSAHRARTSAASSNVTAEQQEIHHFLYRRDGVLVLSKSHCPTTNYPLRTHRDLGSSLNLFAGKTAAGGDLLPRCRAHVRSEFIQPNGKLLNEFTIEHRTRAAIFL